MRVNILSDSEQLNKKKIKRMWQLVADAYDVSEDIVNVKEVSEEEIRVLNKKYLGKDKPTNVLTFSYGEGEHDISLCLVLAEKEAEQRNVIIEEYVGMLLVHAFLHVAGMDHDNVKNEQEMKQSEIKFLGGAGFMEENL